jgi:hypothetical protein
VPVLVGRITYDIDPQTGVIRRVDERRVVYAPIMLR